VYAAESAVRYGCPILHREFMKLTRTQAVRKLTSARDRIASLRDSSANSPRFQHWNEETLRLILDLFPSDSAYEKDYRKLPFGLLFDPHHRAGAPETEDTYLQSLDKAHTILTDLLVALGVPGAAPAGSSLVSDPTDVALESRDVLVLHGPDTALMARITPVITAAECNRVAIPAWPEDRDNLARELAKHEHPVMVWVVLIDSDLVHWEGKGEHPSEVSEEARDAINVALKAVGEEKVLVIIQTKAVLKSNQVPGKSVNIDPRGQWRTALTKLLKSTPA
jgi:hypothetical protein